MADWQPDLAYCISLSRRADRRVAMGNLNAKLGFPVSYFDAVEAPESAPSSWSASPQAWASMTSHRTILEMVPEGQMVLVLEDDAVVPDDFQPVLARFMERLPPIWESVYLGGEHWRVPVLVRGDTVRCTYPTRTLAYILRGDAVKLALRVASGAITHWGVPLGRALAERGTCYAPSPFPIQPSGDSGDIPDAQPARLGLLP